jgi:hypothetical protein
MDAINAYTYASRYSGDARVIVTVLKLAVALYEERAKPTLKFIDPQCREGKGSNAVLLPDSSNEAETSA